MFCTNCGKNLDENADFCTSCGTKLNKDDTQKRINDNQLFCISCGKKLEREEEFCTSCGTKLNIKNNNDLKYETKPVKTKQKKLKPFLNKHKKKLMLIGTLCIVIILSVILFNIFYDFTKISWDKENSDANITRTEPTTLNLKVLAYNKEDEPITDIKFKASAGKIKIDGTSVKWTLPDKEGKYTLTATAPSGKKIKKEVSVVKLDNEGNALFGVAEEVDDKKTDSDNDGLFDAEEKKLKTNPNLIDSDQDGISDYYEVNQTKTDPNLADTDKDGMNDGDELDLGLDPLKSDSKGDGIKDGKRTLSYTINEEENGVTLQINGQGNIASSTIDVFNNSTFSDMKGILDKVYNFHSNGTVSSAIVQIKYDSATVQSKGLNEDNLVLYYFNEETKELEEVPTTVDKENKIIKAELSHFSKYVIGDKTAVIDDLNSQIMFVIDNSVSMYTESQLEEEGYTNIKGAIGNDTEFKRLSLTNKLIDMFTGNYQFGVAEFSGDYVNLKDFTKDQDGVKNTVDSIKSNRKTNPNGTNIITALKKGINEFSSDNNNHYLVLLTDGKNTKGSLSSNKSTIIESAKEKDVKVCVIGLGTEIDTDDLDEIAEATGCDYYNAGDASALDEIYSQVGADINYNYVDTDGDNKVDGMIQANSGFIVNRDGFSFANFNSNKSENGHCYGMATFAMLYYKNELPLSLEAAHKYTIFKRFDASDGYDLSDTYFATNKKLYDYKIENKTLNYLLNEIPSDYRDRIEDKTWMIKEEYYNELNNIGVTFSIKDYSGNDKEFDKYQSALLNIDSDSLESSVSKDEYQMLNAIWRLFILQVDDERTSFSSAPDRAFEELQSHLSSGTPVVTSVNGNHAINSIKLIQDINDSNKFKIEVYDNNYPGETRYIEVTRSKFSKWQLNFTAWTNEYEYKFKYDTDNDGVAEELGVQLHYPNVN